MAFTTLPWPSRRRQMGQMEASCPSYTSSENCSESLQV